MKESKYLYDSWFDDLYEDLAWEQACEEQNNYDKAVDFGDEFFNPIGRRGSVYDEMDFWRTKKTIL